jgi:hypothetical protein
LNPTFPNSPDNAFLKDPITLAAIPKSEPLFMQSLNGEALVADLPEIKSICRFIETLAQRPI